MAPSTYRSTVPGEPLMAVGASRWAGRLRRQPAARATHIGAGSSLHRYILLAVLVVLSAGLLGPALAPMLVPMPVRAAAGVTTQYGARAAAVRRAYAYGRLPVRFEPNRGQAAGRVRFVARGAGYASTSCPTRPC